MSTLGTLIIEFSFKVKTGDTIEFNFNGTDLNTINLNVKYDNDYFSVTNNSYTYTFTSDGEKNVKLYEGFI